MISTLFFENLQEMFAVLLVNGTIFTNENGKGEINMNDIQYKEKIPTPEEYNYIADSVGWGTAEDKIKS